MDLLRIGLRALTVNQLCSMGPFDPSLRGECLIIIEARTLVRILITAIVPVNRKGEATFPQQT